jgi:hypothetical protein
MAITIPTTSVTPPGRSRKRVRRMSAFPPWFYDFPRPLSLGFIRTFNHMPLETSSPKAEVTGSNPVGCANNLNNLADLPGREVAPGRQTARFHSEPAWSAASCGVTDRHGSGFSVERQGNSRERTPCAYVSTAREGSPAREDV